MKIKTSEITVVRNLNGSYALSAVVGTRYMHKQYYGYTKREAIQLFKEFVATSE